MLWFESLLFYGCEEQEQVKDDADISLLPTIVERVVLPKLTGIVLERKWRKRGGMWKLRFVCACRFYYFVNYCPTVLVPVFDYLQSGVIL